MTPHPVEITAYLIQRYRAWSLERAMKLCEDAGYLVHQMEQIGDTWYVKSWRGKLHKLGR